MVEEARHAGRSRAVTTLAALLLLGVALAALLGRGAGLPLRGTRAGVAGHALDRGPDGPLPVATLPGMSAYTGAVRRFPELRRRHMLTGEEIRAYRRGGASAARLAIGKAGGAQVVLVEVQLASAPAAERTLRRLVRLQRGYGLTAPVPVPPPVRAGAVSRRTAQGGWLLRAHYRHGDVLVRITSRGDEYGAAARRFHDALAGQLRILGAQR